MADYEIRIGGERVDPAEGWAFEMVDPVHGVGRLVGEGRLIPVLVEGAGPDRVVTIRGRRVPVTVRSWRERVLAEAETAAREHAGPFEVRASLPGLVVAVTVSIGDEVEEGRSLLTVEAMKMQNEVRAPRPGKVLEVLVQAGQTVATGAALLRIE